MPEPKRRAVADRNDRPVAAKSKKAIDFEMAPSRRKQMMDAMKIVDQAPDDNKPEFDTDRHGFEFDDDEDLLDIFIADKPSDLIADPEGRRLIIKDIFVDNFKSYHGRHQLGPLHKNLTMILGPNGSGKSNVIDALLLVFGFRAKKIRTTKLTSLIHVGEEEAESAMVEIVFQVIKDVDKEKYIVDPKECFTISRSIHLDNTSNYFYNNQVTSQKFIQSLLVNAGIDMTHNRFLILQGEVEAISQMKPVSTKADEEGMLEYIEDIVGTNRYVEAIAKLTHKVKTLEFKSSQYVAICRRHTTLLKEFAPSMQGGVKYVNAVNNLNQIKGFIYKHELALAKAAKQESDEAREQEMAKLEEAKAEMLQNKNDLRAAERAERAAAEKTNRLTTEKTTVEQQITDWTSRDHKLKAQIKAAASELRQMDVEIAKLTDELKQSQEAPEKSKANIENMLVEMQQMLESKNKLEKVYTANLQKFDAKSTIERDKVAMLNEKSERQAQEIYNLQSQIQDFEAELRDMKVTGTGDEKRVVEMKKKLENIMHQNKQEVERLKQHQNAADEWSAKKNEQLGRIPGLNGTIKLLRNQKYSLDRKVDELEDRGDGIYDNRHNNTTMLHKWKEDGRLPGFLGRLGDLASISKKFDAAISTIFGHHLDYQVTQTKEDVKKAINLLIEHKMQRSAFCFVEFDRNVKEYRMNVAPESFPAPRLFDQIRFENDDIREIYYHIVGDTLVVDTLEEATRLDKKYRGKYPLCNYVGDCLERNGSITGGGRPARNRMRTDSLPISHQHDNRKQNDSKINAQMQSVAAQLANTEEQLRVVNEAIAECEPQIKYHVEQVAKLKKQIVFNEAAVKSLTESIADLELSSAVRPHHIECSEEELSTRKGVVAHMKKQLVDEQKIASQIKKDRDAGEVKARKMFDELVGKHKEQLRLTTERIEQMEADIARERAMLENNPAHITAVKKQLKDLGESYKVTSGVARQYSEVDSVVHNREEEENQEKLRVVSTDLKVALEDYTRVSNERVAADKKYQESLEVYRGMSANMEEINKMIDKAEGKIDHYENLLEEVANGWLTAESLDPSAKYCRTWEDDFQEKVNDGYLIMPEEVDADIIDYRSLYESTPVTVQAPGNIQQLKGMLHNLEVTAENFRIQHDEKGITHYATLVSLQLNELTSASKYVDKLHKHRVKLHDLKMARYEEFSQALSFLGTTTQMLYQLITNGGDASLKFVEEGRSMDPFSGGIKFSVRPATKSWKLIENLSGGEKTLASLCFVFAMHHFRATPLYVMDEIDAALDLNNVRLIANYIKNSERTRNAQFVIISLRNQMFEVGNRLIGIYKTDGSTKHVIINPDKIDEINKGARKTLDNELKELMRKKKREERRARGEEDPEDEEEQLAHSMQRVSLANKRRRTRKLGRLLLSDFGMGEEVTPAEPAVVTELPCQTITKLTETDEEDEWSDANETPKRKPKKKVAKEFDEDEDDQEVPSPPQEITLPSRKRARVKNSSKSSRR